jgi:hypothetical protein
MIMMNIKTAAMVGDNVALQRRGMKVRTVTVIVMLQLLSTPIVVKATISLSQNKLTFRGQSPCLIEK